MENNKERIMNSSLMDILEDEARQRKNKNENIKKKMNNLYLEFQKKKEKSNFKLLEYEKIKLEKEQEVCTFKPKINDYNKIKTKTLNIDFYERTKKWKENKIEK